MKIFVAIPTYDGTLPIEVVRCLMDEQIAAVAGGDEITTMFLPGCSLITMGRNALADSFLKSDCDRLVFVDADISWKMGDLVKLAKMKQDVVAGAYRYKREKEGYPIRFMPDVKAIHEEEPGLVEVLFAPTGFMAINKSVFQRMREHEPNRVYSHDGMKHYCFFENPYTEGQFIGEDVWFCKRWREIGGHVFVAHEITLTHHQGQQKFTGNLGEWLQKGEWKNG